LPEDKRPQIMHYGFEMLSDPTTVLEVKRRIE
jgi:hypothetical protein